MRKHLFSLRWELKLSDMSSILLRSLPFFFHLWQETNMEHARRHLDKVTMELFTHQSFHLRRKSMPILQHLMNQNIHWSSEAFTRRRFIRTFSSLSFCDCRSPSTLEDLLIYLLYFTFAFSFFAFHFIEIIIFLHFKAEVPCSWYGTHWRQNEWKMMIMQYTVSRKSGTRN